MIPRQVLDVEDFVRVLGRVSTEISANLSVDPKVTRGTVGVRAVKRQGYRWV